MSRRWRHGSGDDQSGPRVQQRMLAPGKRALTDRIRAPVQKRPAAYAPPAVASDVHTVAASGVEGSGEPLPHLDKIQRAFGAHDVSHVRAHVGGVAADAAHGIGAEAYATGDHVAFAEPPDLLLAAHEVAHVVQQRRGVQLSGGVGTAGDAHERQADTVAEAVVGGRSAEHLLGDATKGTPGSGIQRKELGVPNTSREVEVVVLEGNRASLVVKLATSIGDTSAAGGETTDVGPVDDASWSVLEPKMVNEANSLGLRLEAALMKSEFSLDLFEGISLALELTGPEASFDLENGGDLSLAQVELKGVADLVKLGGLEAPQGATFKVEVSGTFTIGGKLLAKLAEMVARAEVIAAKADELGKLADDLAKAEAIDKDLSKRRKLLAAQRDALPWGVRDARADFDAKIAALDAEIAENRAHIHATAARSGALQRELATEAKHLTALERKLDGRIAKKLAGRITKAAARKIAAAVAKLLPVLNLVSTIADVVAVLELFVEWAENDFGLPERGDAGPLGGEISWDKGEDGDGPRPDEGDDPATDGSVTVEPSAEGDAGDGGPVAEDGEPAREERSRSRRDPEPGGDVPVSVPDQIHRHARAVLQVIERRGARLDEAQVRALEMIVPSSLTDDEAVQLVQALIERGEALAGQDAHDVLAAVDEAVRDLRPATTRVKVDGVDRPDLGAGGGEESPEETPEEAHGDRGEGDAEVSQDADDLSVIVERLPESVVDSWLSVRRGLDTSGFDAWRDANVGAMIPGKNDWQLVDAGMKVESAAKGGRWSLEVVFYVDAGGGVRSFPHYFFVDVDVNGQPYAERIHMFTVRP